MRNSSAMPREMEQRLREIIRKAVDVSDGDCAFVGFSGGVDSSLLLWETVQTLGFKKVIAITASSVTSPPGQEQSARDFATKIEAQHIVMDLGEFHDPEFLNNSASRCYICKKIRYERLMKFAKRTGGGPIFDGTQSDDNPRDRPGMRALRELGIVTPLADAGIGKELVRILLREAGFHELAEKPSQPCLATRIPTGVPLTRKVLKRIGLGESRLNEMGIDIVRLRDHDQMARIVTDAAGISKILGRKTLREKICTSLRKLGYKHITVDLDPY